LNLATTAVSPRYTRTAVILHWLMAANMIFMLFFSEDFIRVPRGQSLDGWQPTTHASWGLMVLLLVAARLLWRVGHKPPPPPAMPRWQAIASHATHHSLYALMILIPIFGLLALVPYGAERLDVDKVVFFNLFSVAFMPNLGAWTMDAHEILGNIAKALIVLHVIAALKHQFWDKDGLLQRMNPFSK
jgi:cytochrome b561